MDIPKQLTSSTKNNSDVDIAADYQYSRSNYYKLIDAGNEAITEMLELAKETQHPRSFEVLGKLIKDISDVNDRLLKMQKANKELTTEEADTPKLGGVTNNNLFVGSTTDLQRMLADAASEKEIVHDPK